VIHSFHCRFQDWTVHTTDANITLLSQLIPCAAFVELPHVLQIRLVWALSKHIAFQIDRCHWKTYLLKSKIVLSLKATRVASDDWISISGTQSIIYWNSKSICRNLHLLSALSNLENDSWTNGSKSSKSEYNSGFLPFKVWKCNKFTGLRSPLNTRLTRW